MSLNIRLYVTPDFRHAPFVYDGLKQLRLEGSIDSIILIPDTYHHRDRVIIKNKNVVRINRPYPYTIIIKIMDNNKKIIIGFDLQDWDYMFSHHSLKHCKIIFKRAFNQDMVDIIQKKYNGVEIRPFGFTYNTDFKDISFFRMSKISKLLNVIFYAFIGQKYLFRYIYRQYSKMGTFKNKNDGSIIQLRKKVPEHNYIFFQVEYHNYSNHSESIMLNDYRSEVIRTLKKEFGNNFIGGIWSKGNLDKTYYDCQSEYLDKTTYFSLINNATIVISTNGFGDSIPWKLAEYLKLGKCIVSQKLKHKLPHPLVDDLHFKTFHDIDQCIEICRNLLNNSNKTRELGDNARVYYDKYIDPKIVINNYIHQSINNLNNHN